MKWLIAALTLSALPALADVRDDFIKKVQQDCGKSAADAETLATGGRTGNVIKWKTCPQNPVEVAPDCKVKCSTDGQVIN